MHAQISVHTSLAFPSTISLLFLFTPAAFSGVHVFTTRSTCITMDDREQAIAAAKQRVHMSHLRPCSCSASSQMAAFRLRHSPTNATFTAPQPKLHARSHSRNNSVTSFPISTLNAPAPADDVQETPGPVPTSPSLPSRPNSHHRRRSSVSTRRESAEMMGVTPPPENTSDLPGDQSDFRHLTLWKLEGKSCSDNAFIGGFTKVEIPELNTAETDAIEAVQCMFFVLVSCFYSRAHSQRLNANRHSRLLAWATHLRENEIHSASS